jgi:anti-sigma B factor antagonist
MKATVRDASNVRIVDLKGKMTLGGGDVVVRDIVANLLKEDHKQIVLNLSNVDYIDSAGIGELVASKKRAAAAGGDVRLLLPSESVYKVLSIVSLHLIFQIFEDEAQAVGSF